MIMADNRCGVGHHEFFFTVSDSNAEHDTHCWTDYYRSVQDCRTHHLDMSVIKARECAI
jgi:hypothetical protein